MGGLLSSPEDPPNVVVVALVPRTRNCCERFAKFEDDAVPAKVLPLLAVQEYSQLMAELNDWLGTRKMTFNGPVFIARLLPAVMVPCFIAITAAMFATLFRSSAAGSTSGGLPTVFIPMFVFVGVFFVIAIAFVFLTLTTAIHEKNTMADLQRYLINVVNPRFAPRGVSLEIGSKMRVAVERRGISRSAVYFLRISLPVGQPFATATNILPSQYYPPHMSYQQQQQQPFLQPQYQGYQYQPSYSPSLQQPQYNGSGGGGPYGPPPLPYPAAAPWRGAGGAAVGAGGAPASAGGAAAGDGGKPEDDDPTGLPSAPSITAAAASAAVGATRTAGAVSYATSAMNNYTPSAPNQQPQFNYSAMGTGTPILQPQAMVTASQHSRVGWHDAPPPPSSQYVGPVAPNAYFTQQAQQQQQQQALRQQAQQQQQLERFSAPSGMSPMYNPVLALQQREVSDSQGDPK